MPGKLSGSIILTPEQREKLSESDLKGICTLTIDGMKFEFMVQELIFNHEHYLPCIQPKTTSADMRFVQLVRKEVPESIPQAVIDMKFRP